MKDSLLHPMGAMSMFCYYAEKTSYDWFWARLDWSIDL